MKDGSFDVLQVRNTLYVNNIEANTITMNDTTLKGNIHTTGKKVKELYEKQRNTNAFEDHHKSVVEGLEKVCTINDVYTVNQPMFTKMYKHGEIDDETMPDNTSVICLDDERKPIYKMKIDGEIQYVSMGTYKPNIKIDLGSIMSLES
jgi:hypothetical protein